MKITPRLLCWAKTKVKKNCKKCEYQALCKQEIEELKNPP